MQAVPFSRQVLSEQQGPPTTPHIVQVRTLAVPAGSPQLAFGSLQVHCGSPFATAPGQQGWPTEPHPHLVSVQVP
jgi:hypothetical protein